MVNWWLPLWQTPSLYNDCQVQCHFHVIYCRHTTAPTNQVVHTTNRAPATIISVTKSSNIQTKTPSPSNPFMLSLSSPWTSSCRRSLPFCPEIFSHFPTHCGHTIQACQGWAKISTGQLSTKHSQENDKTRKSGTYQFNLKR